MRICSREGCGQKHYGKGLCRKHYDANPEVVAQKIARAKAHPERNKEYQRRYRLKSKHVRQAQHLRKAYGLTLEQYDALLKAQGGKCALYPCLSKERSERLCVDHCHKTGKIRGLLCKDCNGALGKLGDDAPSIEKALSYLKKAV